LTTVAATTTFAATEAAAVLLSSFVIIAGQSLRNEYESLEFPVQFYFASCQEAFGLEAGK